MKRLIISPQAGMCNRFRALANALMLGDITGRQVFHNWEREPVNTLESLHIQHMRASTLSDFFQVDDLPYMQLTTHTCIDAAFSEWRVNDPWYPGQCSALARSNRHNLATPERQSANRIIASIEKTILLETSLALKPNNMSYTKACKIRAHIYKKHFVAKANYIAASKEVIGETPFIGVHIRRGDMLNWDKRANLSVKQWITTIQKLVPQNTRILLCSDDDAFKHAIAKRLNHHFITTDLKSRLNQFNDIEQAFIEFLALSQAQSIIGTSSSSFSIEAALFGGIPYQSIALAA